eukprot:TRINITY_DN6044_c1_g1_i1.p1 TRINITY_DN6044_c1_g1~~TRINITY_DN6044_c1_g1_i1.p1  ORF type:complete len:143 (-),score=23.31 TRINITY_DN6044_c1_g1_i1:7-435(-)
MGSLTANAAGMADYMIDLDLISWVEIKDRCVILHNTVDSCEGSTGHAGARLAQGLVVSACEVAMGTMALNCGLDEMWMYQDGEDFCNPTCVDALSEASLVCVGNMMWKMIIWMVRLLKITFTGTEMLVVTSLRVMNLVMMLT